MMFCDVLIDSPLAVQSKKFLIKKILVKGNGGKDLLKINLVLFYYLLCTFLIVTYLTKRNIYNNNMSIIPAK